MSLPDNLAAALLGGGGEAPTDDQIFAIWRRT
jgi:hypothetical protein